MFGKKQKKVRGIELIDKVTSRFSAMVSELEEGICDCKAEQANIHDQITLLHQRDLTLGASVNKASVMADNLSKLIGE